LITTPTEKSVSVRFDYEEMIPLAKADNPLKLTQLTKISNEDAQTVIDEHTSIKPLERSFPKIKFNKTTNEIPKHQNQVKRVNKISKVWFKS
jgi:hypothetical protein